PAYPAPASGTAPTPALSEHDERVWSLAAHLLVFVGGFLAPLVIWLVFRGRSDFLEHHAKEALNFQITVLLAAGLFLIMILAFIGYLFLLLLAIAAVALPIIAAARAHGGDWFRYPVALRLVK
ncbi:MAG: DUF4870 domain-containing protein, partial [Actinomycetia bacterium]|nr:DUF4870 domain-containing protein [Actinomycetes bacterium]